MVHHHSHGCGLQKSQRNSKAKRRGRLTAKTTWLNTTVTPDQESTEDWLGHDIQDTVEHSLRVGRDDVATFRKSPSNWVQEP